MLIQGCSLINYRYIYKTYVINASYKYDPMLSMQPFFSQVCGVFKSLVVKPFVQCLVLERTPEKYYVQNHILQ